MKLTRHIIIMICLLTSGNLLGQVSVYYVLQHNPPPAKISISISFDTIPASSIKLVIPRSAPGTYD